MSSRRLNWEGCFNVRDLGGLVTRDGRRLRRGLLVRGDAPDLLTPAGWAAVREHGIRTVIDLRNADEREAAVESGLQTLVLELDGMEDREFWNYWAAGRHGTPIYYRPFLERFPERVAGVFRLLSEAEPGVFFHCGIGRDRTGLIAILLLNLLDISLEQIVEDYELSALCLPPLMERRQEPDHLAKVAQVLADHNTTNERLIQELLTDFDAKAYLQRGGLTPEQLESLRTRFLE